MLGCSFFYKRLSLSFGMKMELVSTPNRISTLKGALKYCQDFARICYSEKGIEGVRQEAYNPGLTEGRLIKSGHHSVFDHFNLSLYFDGLPKAMAMVLNNEPPYATSEKSARYTEMSDIQGDQKILYDKWNGIFANKIDAIFPNVKGRDVAIKKLAQENARYLTSVFTPTKMGYTISLRHLNEIADEFEKFGNGLEGNLFKERVFEEGMLPFLESDVVKRFRVRDLKPKYREGVKLFGEPIEEIFGGDSYSTNLDMSFACLAQNQRHRTIRNKIVGDVEQGAPFGYFVPPIIGADSDLSEEWGVDMGQISEGDFPQGQIVRVSEKGTREDLEMKLRERNCGLPQLEIVRVMDGLLEKYSEHVPEMGKLRGANCLTQNSKCGKGGCTFGPKNAVSRLI